jgi:hypothetical protein
VATGDSSGPGGSGDRTITTGQAAAAMGNSSGPGGGSDGNSWRARWRWQRWRVGGPDGCGGGMGQVAAATTTVGRPGGDRQQQRARWAAAEMESGRARRLWGWNGPGGGSDDNGGRARQRRRRR